MSENTVHPDTMLELGQTGLVRFGGFVFEEFLRELQGPKGMAVYREMNDNDPTVGAIMFAIDQLCRKVAFRVDPHSQEQEDQVAAEFLRSCLDDMSATWTDTISEILTMIPFGFSWHEEVYKFRLGVKPGLDDEGNPLPASKHNDGLLGWRRLPIRAQETLWMWNFSDGGSIEGFVQRAAPRFNTVTIPMGKSLLFRHRAHKNNPEGRSALRNAYRPWYFKKKLEIIEAIGIERDLAGLPVAWVPPDLLKANAPADKKAQLAMFQKMVTNIRNDEQGGIVFPLMYDDKGQKVFDLTLLSTAGRRSIDTNVVITRYDEKIAQSMLADLILIGTNGRGSYAMMEAKVDLFTQALEGWLDSIMEILNRHAVPRLFARNGFKLDNLPLMAHGPVDAPDLKDLAAYVTALAGGQPVIQPTPEDEAYLREVGHLPTPDQDVAIGKVLKRIFAGWKHRT